MRFTRVTRTVSPFTPALSSLALLTATIIGLGSPVAAQSREFMMNECSSAGQIYFRDFTARMDVQYDGQRVDGTHAINGRIFLETRFEDFACSYGRSGRRIVEFFAEGRTQANTAIFRIN